MLNREHDLKLLKAALQKAVAQNDPHAHSLAQSAINEILREQLRVETAMSELGWKWMPSPLYITATTIALDVEDHIPEGGRWEKFSAKHKQVGKEGDRRWRRDLLLCKLGLIGAPWQVRMRAILNDLLGRGHHAA